MLPVLDKGARVRQHKAVLRSKQFVPDFPVDTQSPGIPLALPSW